MELCFRFITMDADSDSRGYKKARNLNVFHLGDDVASGLGTHVERERGVLLLIAVALAGASVAAGGAIAF